LYRLSTYRYLDAGHPLEVFSQLRHVPTVASP
jgi:hypothetical protein